MKSKNNKFDKKIKCQFLLPNPLYQRFNTVNIETNGVIKSNRQLWKQYERYYSRWMKLRSRVKELGIDKRMELGCPKYINGIMENRYYPKSIYIRRKISQHRPIISHNSHHIISNNRACSSSFDSSEQLHLQLKAHVNPFTTVIKHKKYEKESNEQRSRINAKINQILNTRRKNQSTQQMARSHERNLSIELLENRQLVRPMKKLSKGQFIGNKQQQEINLSDLLYQKIKEKTENSKAIKKIKKQCFSSLETAFVQYFKNPSQNTLPKNNSSSHSNTRNIFPSTEISNQSLQNRQIIQTKTLIQKTSLKNIEASLINNKFILFSLSDIDINSTHNKLQIQNFNNDHPPQQKYIVDKLLLRPTEIRKYLQMFDIGYQEKQLEGCYRQLIDVLIDFVHINEYGLKIDEKEIRRKMWGFRRKNGNHFQTETRNQIGDNQVGKFTKRKNQKNQINITKMYKAETVSMDKRNNKQRETNPENQSIEKQSQPSKTQCKPKYKQQQKSYSASKSTQQLLYFIKNQMPKQTTHEKFGMH